MALREDLHDAPSHWPSADEVQRAAANGALVILPDRLEATRGRLVAAFRGDAQDLRIRAKRKGLDARLLAPDDAELTVYSEHAADWVLPVVVAAALAVPSGVVADLLHDRIEDARRSEVTMPEVRYREAYVEDGQIRLREIEGPADEVLQLLRERPTQPDVPTKYPGLSPTPPPAEDR